MIRGSKIFDKLPNTGVDSIVSEWIREAWSTNQVTGAMCTWPGLRVKSYSMLKRLVVLRLKLKLVSFRRIRLDSKETWIELFIL
jgi:hypothetical protein